MARVIHCARVRQSHIARRQPRAGRRDRDPNAGQAPLQLLSDTGSKATTAHPELLRRHRHLRAEQPRIYAERATRNQHGHLRKFVSEMSAHLAHLNCNPPEQQTVEPQLATSRRAESDYRPGSWDNNSNLTEAVIGSFIATAAGGAVSCNRRTRPFRMAPPSSGVSSCASLPQRSARPLKTPESEWLPAGNRHVTELVRDDEPRIRTGTGCRPSRPASRGSSDTTR